MQNSIRVTNRKLRPTDSIGIEKFFQSNKETIAKIPIFAILFFNDIL